MIVFFYILIIFRLVANENWTDYLIIEEIQRVEMSEYSPDLNSLEHVWVTLSRQIRSLRLPTSTLQELQGANLRAYALSPEEHLGNIHNMENSILRLICF